ncbi:MAG: TonB-dependent receptor [Burkholderiales bacterium]|nr:TonB-dependent receptor [Burkholderiales bacterium]
MKHSNPQRRSRSCPTPLTATAVGAALLISAFAAQAQDATQTVTVTGIRKGIEDAISVKRNSDSIVEAISAEDIGKLPDTTIAESLSRLPGLTAQRTKDGRASSVSIRGLGPDFNGYLLNGREQTSIGDSRGVDLSVYPAELIGGATVYKTSDATLMAAGLAGTLDIRLVDPLAFPSRVVSASAQKITTGKGLPVEGSGNRYSLAYIDQFADRKIGLALGFVHADGTTNQLNSGGWGGATVNATLTDGSQMAGVKVPAPWGGGLDYASQRITDKRDGAAAIVVYKPNKEFSSELDLFYSKINSYTKKQYVKGGLGGPITNATVVNGTATKGTFQLGATPGGLVDYIEGIGDNDELNSLGWKSTWKFADGWSASFDVNHNTAKRVERDVEAYAGIVGADTLTFDATGGGTPKLTLGNPLAYTTATTIAVRDQTGWSGVNYPDGSTVPQAGYTKGPTIEDKVDAIRLDFKHDLSGGMFTDVQFGTNYSTRTKDRSSDEGLIVSASGVGRDRIALPAGSYIEKNIGGTGLDMLTFDPQVGLWDGAKLLRKFNDDILSKTWGVEEKVTTAYAKANIDTELSGVAVRGNVGVQLVNSDQSAKGYRAGVGSGVTLDNPAGRLTKAGTNYTDLLPSLNLSGDLGGGNTVRLGVSQQIARASLTDLRNSFAASVDTDASHTATFGKFVGSAGNPFLKPFKAKSLDLSYEKYFGKSGYVGVAAFYKKLDSYITTATNSSFDFAAYAAELGLTVPPAGTVGTFTTSVNGSGGDLSGVELSASAPFNLLSKMLDGFGASASYSETSSSVSLPNTLGQNPNQQVSVSAGRISLPGLSKQNAKLMLYYEKAGFSAFVAQNYRSTYVGSVANDATGGYPTLRYIQGSSWVSAQVGYEMQDGPLKGLSLRLEGNNLNKPVYRQLKGDGVTVDTETKTGAEVAVRVAYKF